MTNYVKKTSQKKERIDRVYKNAFLSATIFSASTVILIVLFITLKGLSPFVKGYLFEGQIVKVNVFKFLTGFTWFKSPNLYGIGFVIINTIYVAFLSLVITVPIAVLTALMIVRIAGRFLSKILINVFELLAAIPSVIYGVFGVGVITKVVKRIALAVGYQSAGGISTLSAVIVLAMMILPTITSISINAISRVNNSIIEASLALGASETETNFKIVLRDAKSGIFAGIILGLGRALGEATAVSMVAGNSGSGPNFNLFETTRTLTSTILLGLNETTGLDYDIRFSVALVLIFIILGSNILLNYVKKRID